MCLLFSLGFQPSELLQQWTDDDNGEMKVKIVHGTTTLAFKFQHGIIVAVDSRATGGQYIGMRTGVLMC